MSAVVFHHIFTGKSITVLDKKSVVAIIHGTAKGHQSVKDVECVFLLLDKIPQPTPVSETEEEVMALLGLTNTEKKHE